MRIGGGGDVVVDLLGQGWWASCAAHADVCLRGIMRRLFPCHLTSWPIIYLTLFWRISRMLLACRFAQLRGGYEQMTATTWRWGNAMPYFHDNVASALLGSANGLIWAARGWECAQLGPFSVLLQDYTAVYALRSFVRVEWLQINFLCLASVTRGPLLFLVILECLCTEQAVFFAIICSLRYCTVEAVNARTTPQNFRFCDFAARDSYGHVKLQNSS